MRIFSIAKHCCEKNERTLNARIRHCSPKINMTVRITNSGNELLTTPSFQCNIMTRYGR